MLPASGRPSRAPSRQVHNRGMSLAPPESAGPLRRERLRTARLYFVCDARPGGEDPEALLRAALSGGVDIVQLREKELGRARDRTRRLDLPPRLRHLQRPLHRQRRPRPGPRLRRRRRPRRPGRRLGRGGAGAARARRDHRPLDPLRGADRRRHRAPGRLHQRRADLGDADESGPAGGRPRAGLPRRRARDPPLLRDRRHRPRQRRAGRAGRARGGSARCGRSATPPTRARRPKRCAAPSPPPRAPRRAARTSCWTSRRPGGVWRPVAEERRKRKERGARAGWRAATPRPRSATRRRAKRWSRWPRASGRWW